MSAIATYDAIIVGGGPAGSTCATLLVNSGVHTLLLDRANFPRVKLCTGWLSSPVWDILGISPKEYPRGLWEWNKGEVPHRRRWHTLPGGQNLIPWS
jgi:flavin-dependent dehydrogenase